MYGFRVFVTDIRNSIYGSDRWKYSNVTWSKLPNVSFPPEKLSVDLGEHFQLFGQWHILCCFFLGYGVFLTEKRKKSSFLLEYAGELISAAEGHKREVSGIDSVFRFYIKHMEKSLW